MTLTASGYVRSEGMVGVREAKTDEDLALHAGLTINVACERNGLPLFMTTSVQDLCSGLQM